ncbi:hypothetical protein SAMN04490243_2780 [Robiginitalea myxolifaciens]|uniref:DUF4468 domain-containing protein n=1 Tax=Robiginitalea myxolifaciens TaxID=400055 RepID=A0A1I6HI83_9FLAO|nr:hypothetical protein [Robiginitalea myxolifaciens]SFR54171.1 hypothetical protein SAMN04490243_2780 [Robiginitalea myxolifaciens]
MNRLRNVLICCLAGLSFAQAQTEINAYKYLIVPTRFENFRQTNQYNTSTLTKYHLTQMGFPAVYDNKLPRDLRIDPCLGLMTAMVEEGNMFRSRIKFVFSDCEGKVVYETYHGESKSKDFAESYKEAIADALLGSMQGMTYSYDPPEDPQEEEVPAESAAPAEVVAEATAAEEAVQEEVSTAKEAGKDEVSAAETEVMEVEEQVVMAEENPQEEQWEASDMLYAQPIANGYQLVDSTPTVRMVLLNSSRPDNYIAMVDGVAKGTVYQEGETWWHEYIQDNVVFRVALNVKF